MLQMTDSVIKAKVDGQMVNLGMFGTDASKLQEITREQIMINEDPTENTKMTVDVDLYHGHNLIEDTDLAQFITYVDKTIQNVSIAPKTSTYAFIDIPTGYNPLCAVVVSPQSAGWLNLSVAHASSGTQTFVSMFNTHTSTTIEASSMVVRVYLIKA